MLFTSFNMYNVYTNAELYHDNLRSRFNFNFCVLYTYLKYSNVTVGQ